VAQYGLSPIAAYENTPYRVAMIEHRARAKAEKAKAQ
jgi:hypothetical protein